MSLNDGGLAFPGKRHEEEELFEDQREIFTAHHGGMTLRDYFAAKAMQGELAKDPVWLDVNHLAEYCYKIADAMLKARNK